MHNRLCLGILVAAVATLSACQSRPATIPSLFQISKEEGAIATAGTRQHGTGTLTIRIDGFLNSLRARRLLATTSDVAYVVVSVVDANSTVWSRIIDKAAISDGQLTATFPNIVVGEAEVQMTAYGSNDEELGYNSRKVTVSAGATTVVSLPVVLSPTVTIVPPASGGGGSSSPSTGNIDVNGSVIDGYEISVYDIGATSELITPDNAATGGVWVATTTGRLMHVSADGVIETMPGQANEAPWAMAADETGHLWVPGGLNGNAVRIDPRQGIDSTTWSYSYFLARSSNGTVWSSLAGNDAAESFSSYDATGAQRAMAAPGIYIADLAADSDGTVWANSDPFHPFPDYPNVAIKYSADCVELARAELPGRPWGIDVDASHQVWTATTAGVCKVSPAGALLGTYMTGSEFYDVLASTKGHQWAVSHHKLCQLDGDGNTIAEFELAAIGSPGPLLNLVDPMNGGALHGGGYLAEDTLGNIWLIAGSKLIKITL